MTRVQADPAFAYVKAAEIDAARANHSPNAIGDEIARLIQGCRARFAGHCERIGRVPTEWKVAKPKTEIERAAMELANQAIAEELGQPLEIIWT